MFATARSVQLPTRLPRVGGRQGSVKGTATAVGDPSTSLGTNAGDRYTDDMDIVFLLVVGAFFALAALIVRGCDLLLGADTTRATETDEQR